MGISAAMRSLDLNALFGSQENGRKQERGKEGEFGIVKLSFKIGYESGNKYLNFHME